MAEDPFATMPLDPTDPLALMLHADELVAPPPDSEPDWAALSAALWAAEHKQPQPMLGFPPLDGGAFDFDYGLGAMDMVIDPSALGTDGFYVPEPLGPYPFDTLGPAGELPARRLSVTSSSSSSGASLSPVMNAASVTPSPQAPVGGGMNPDSFAALIKTLSSNPALLNGDFSSLAIPGGLHSSCHGVAVG
jgi:hypothetical protein